MRRHLEKRNWLIICSLKRIMMIKRFAFQRFSILFEGYNFRLIILNYLYIN